MGHGAAPDGGPRPVGAPVGLRARQSATPACCMRLACPPAAVQQLSLLAGVAVIDAIGAAAAGAVPGLRLKWPNDVLDRRGKVRRHPARKPDGRGNAAGLLAVIGIGINLAWHPEDWGAPRRIWPHTACGAGAGGNAGPSGRRHGALAWHLGLRVSVLRAIRAAWLERGGPIGESLTVDTGRERIEGNSSISTTDGALIMREAVAGNAG